jgi:hypothetical protein|tara:strand:- start:78 stop:305 length:228 start_codon:yes stop_codon:yes gene_type:complete
MIYRVICFDNSTDIKNSVSDVMETTSLFSALTRLLSCNFHKKDPYGDPIIKAGLYIYNQEKLIYSSQYVRKFLRS